MEGEQRGGDCDQHRPFRGLGNWIDGLKLRGDAAKLSQLGNLSARGTSRTETLAEALDWESAWAKVAAAWAPLPANTLPALKALRKQCTEDLQTAYSDAGADWRGEAGKLARMAADLEALNEAWYADATLALPASTPEGYKIRGTVSIT